MLKITRLSNKSVFKKNNDSKLIFKKNNNNNKINRFDISVDIKFFKNLGKSKSQKLFIFQKITKSEKKYSKVRF